MVEVSNCLLAAQAFRTRDVGVSSLYSSILPNYSYARGRDFRPRSAGRMVGCSTYLHTNNYKTYNPYNTTHLRVRLRQTRHVSFT